MNRPDLSGYFAELTAELNFRLLSETEEETMLWVESITVTEPAGGATGNMKQETP